jgi:DNA-binding MurR/RpiR family transcriptional regulator
MKGVKKMSQSSISFLEKTLEIAKPEDVEFLVELLFDLKREEEGK